jgi:diguanylate cyclase
MPSIRTISGSLRSCREAPSERKLMLLVRLVAIAGAILLVAAVSTILVDPPPLHAAVFVVAAASLWADATFVNLRVGHHVESYTWAEVILVVGLALVAPPYLVASALCVGIAHLVTRRSAVKVVFNAGAYAIGVALAAGTTHLIAMPSWDHPARSAVALGAGVVMFSLWNGLTVAAAIAFSQDLPFRRVHSKGAGLRALVSAGNFAVGLGILWLVEFAPEALFALPTAMLMAYLGYRSYLHFIQERAVWRHLEGVSHEVSRVDEREIAEAALARAASLLEADEVEVSLYHGDGGKADVYGGTAAGVRSVRTEPRYREIRFAVTTYPAVSRPGEEAAEETCVLAPLAGRDEQIGVMRVRFHGRVKLSRRERQVLTTFSHTVASSIENARMYNEMRAHAVRSEAASLHDGLTGLANRALLTQRVEEALAGDRPFGLMVLDLDHFKEVNDTLGHGSGDVVLCEIAKRLRGAVRAHDTVARLGGDEFAIMLSDVSAADVTATRLLAVVGGPVDLDGVLVAVGGSAGFASYPDDGVTFDELLQRADSAMYEAKQQRGTYRRHRTAGDSAGLDELGLVSELRTALERDELELHYQPQLDLATGHPLGAEAFVRWQHPARGMLTPAEFLPIVESSSLLRDFTVAVLDMAVAECSRWQEDGRDLNVAVNISARSIADPRLAGDVTAALGRHGLAAERLVLEVAETAILGDLDAVEGHLARLAATGVRISIDNFGTGQASLTFLQRVMIHELKIDRSFVAAMVNSEDDLAITRATVRLAHSLGLQTVAEGVEEAGALRQLVDLECDRGQGYHWTRPVPAEQVRELLRIPETLRHEEGVPSQ